jgi:NitT/TauT family transport system ATP-binding protein
MMKQMEVASVTKTYPHSNEHIVALKDITFNVHQGEFICIIGPSGCGKSTLLKIIAGLDKPSSGEIRFEGAVVTKPHPKISMVFQSFAIFPWRTILQNVEYGLEIRGVPKQQRRKIAEEFIDLVGLTGYENLYPKQLSGGMKQRVGLARALAIDPEIILMDEAFSAIDEFTAETLREEVAEIHGETEKTFLLVTHNLPEAIELADRIVVLSARPGRVKSVVEVSLKRPRDKTDSEFVHIHKGLFDLLKEELENSIIRHKIRELKEFQKLHDMELK